MVIYSCVFQVDVLCPIIRVIVEYLITLVLYTFFDAQHFSSLDMKLVSPLQRCI